MLNKQEAFDRSKLLADQWHNGNHTAVAQECANDPLLAAFVVQALNQPFLLKSATTQFINALALLREDASNG